MVFSNYCTAIKHRRSKRKKNKKEDKKEAHLQQSHINTHTQRNTFPLPLLLLLMLCRFLAGRASYITAILVAVATAAAAVCVPLRTSNHVGDALYAKGARARVQCKVKLGGGTVI